MPDPDDIALTHAVVHVDAIAYVRTFGGERKEIRVNRVWFADGAPERIWGTDGERTYKFKRDEEPFDLCFFSKEEI